MQIKNTEEINQALVADEIKPKAKLKSKPLKTVSETKPAVLATPGLKAATKQSIKQTAPVVSKVEAVKEPANDEIWNAIRGRELGLFGLTDQTIEKYCTPINLEPSKCILKYKVSSVVPAVEGVVTDFTFEVAGPYLVISKKK